MTARGRKTWGQAITTSVIWVLGGIAAVWGWRSASLMFDKAFPQENGKQ